MQQHWLTRPAVIRKLWWIFAGVLALTVGAEAFVTVKPHFQVETIFGFSAWFGFLGCAALIGVAKVLGLVLKRPDRYYDEPGDG